jgi:hypothetical protein
VKRWCYVAALALVLAGCSTPDRAGPTPSAAPAINLRGAASGEFIVTAKPSVSADQVRRVYAAFGVQEIRDLGRNRFLLRLGHDPGVDRVRSIGFESGKIEAVQPNYVYRTR